MSQLCIRCIPTHPTFEAFPSKGSVPKPHCKAIPSPQNQYAQTSKSLQTYAIYEGTKFYDQRTTNKQVKIDRLNSMLVLTTNNQRIAHRHVTLTRNWTYNTDKKSLYIFTKEKKSIQTQENSDQEAPTEQCKQ